MPSLSFVCLLLAAVASASAMSLFRRVPIPTTSAPPNGFTTFDGNYYMHVPHLIHFNKALAYCKQQGASLVSIHSDAENEFVATLGTRGRWIGLLRTGPGPKAFNWTDGTPFDYNSWYADEPDDLGGRENCVGQGQVIFNNKTGWNDLRCDEKLVGFVCKIWGPTTTTSTTTTTTSTTTTTTSTTTTTTTTTTSTTTTTTTTTSTTTTTTSTTTTTTTTTTSTTTTTTTTTTSTTTTTTSTTTTTTSTTTTTTTSTTTTTTTTTTLACVKGVDNCYECTASGSACKKCNNQKYLYDGICVDTCPTGYTNTGGTRLGRTCTPDV